MNRSGSENKHQEVKRSLNSKKMKEIVEAEIAYEKYQERVREFSHQHLADMMPKGQSQEMTSEEVKKHGERLLAKLGIPQSHLAMQTKVNEAKVPPVDSTEVSSQKSGADPSLKSGQKRLNERDLPQSIEKSPEGPQNSEVPETVSPVLKKILNENIEKLEPEAAADLAKLVKEVTDQGASSQKPEVDLGQKRFDGSSPANLSQDVEKDT